MLLAFLVTILAISKPSLCMTTENVKSSGIQNLTPANSSMPPILDATASKLVRYRSKPPPPNFFRYKSQPHNKHHSRPRIIKSPKIKNNRPMFTHFEQSLAQPSSYYKFKPEIHTSTLAYKPSYSYDEIHYEVSLPKKESNYETQAMDLDFYGGETYPKKKTASQYEYTKPQKAYTKPQKIVTQYEFTKPQKVYTAQRPHNLYDSPKESSYNSYDFNFESKPEVHYEISYHEETPEQQDYEPAPPPPKHKYEDFPPYGAPPAKKFHQTEQVSYQLPDNKYEAPEHPYHSQEYPSKEVSYQAYDEKLLNNGYSYNKDFGEPPTDIHIIHSPSYDIETLPKKQSFPQKNYEQPHETYGPPPSENYGPPSDVYGPPEYNKQSQGNQHAPMDSYHPPSSGQFAEPPGSYLPPPHQPDDLPLNKNHMPPGYDYPKSSYEVPLYDPIPFESTTAEQEDFFPPNNYNGPPQHDHASESTSTNIQHIPSTSAVSTTSTTKEQEQVPQANTKVHRFSPSKRRLKKPNRYQTTAKTPISSEEPAVPEAPSSEFLDEIISTTTTFRPRRKRKRTKAPLVAEKHNLDVPELKEAFESGIDHEQTDELTAHASTIKENIHVQPSQETIKIQKTTDFSPTHSWNPMRIRTKQTTNDQRAQRTSQTALNDLKNVEVISIQKSHSHSYYAGTESPRTRPSPPPTKRTRKMTSRADAIKMPTVSTTTLKAENALKPTRGLVIDTTYFKVKGNEEDEFYDGTGKLPKNHKLF